MLDESLTHRPIGLQTWLAGPMQTSEILGAARVLANPPLGQGVGKYVTDDVGRLDPGHRFEGQLTDALDPTAQDYQVTVGVHANAFSS
jgi:hypothetical protein